MAPLPRFHAVVPKPCDPSNELRLLAARLQEELGDQETRLAIDHLDSNIVIAYHSIVIMYWKVVAGQLVCVPTAWHRQTYTAPCAVRAREITIRLAFDFVRQSCSSVWSLLRTRQGPST
jgi:hypothetical protein